MLKTKTCWVNLVLIVTWLSACGGPIGPAPATKTCSDLQGVVEAFYAANDASQPAVSVQYLTDDVTLVTWAEGANGHHMFIHTAVGKDQIQSFLGNPGLKRSRNGPELPNYTIQEIQRSEAKLAFKLIPDRKHANGRPYNPYYVEVFFSGCQIELLKVVERVTWL